MPDLGALAGRVRRAWRQAARCSAGSNQRCRRLRPASSFPARRTSARGSAQPTDPRRLRANCLRCSCSAGRVRVVEGCLPRRRRRWRSGGHPGARGTDDQDRRVPACPDVGPAPDRRLRTGVAAPAVRAVELRLGRGRDRADGRQADGASARALRAWEAGPGRHARRRASYPRRISTDAGRPARPSIGYLRTVIPRARDHPLRGHSAGVPAQRLSAV